MLSHAALCHLCGTRPRLANSSRMRGMTPGSAAAWTEKENASGARWRSAPDSAGAAVSNSRDDIEEILGKMRANQQGPSPEGARVANSPDAGGMCRPHDARNVSLGARHVKPSASCTALRKMVIPGVERSEAARDP